MCLLSLSSFAVRIAAHATGCPANSHTGQEASVRLEQCICDGGFERVNASADGSITCECPAGYEIAEANGKTKCSPCNYGTWKATTGNVYCTRCAVLHASTLEAGATSEAACVCAVNYYMPPRSRALPVDEWYNFSAPNATRTCRRCDEDCPPGEACTRCDEAGHTILTVPLTPGFWRVNVFSNAVLECSQEQSDLICRCACACAREATPHSPHC